MKCHRWRYTIMDKKVKHSLYLLFIIGALGIGISFIAVGVKNLTDSDELAKALELSRLYERDGYNSINEWKNTYENNNKQRILIGVFMIVAVGGVFAFRKTGAGESARTRKP